MNAFEFRLKGNVWWIIIGTLSNSDVESESSDLGVERRWEISERKKSRRVWI